MLIRREALDTLQKLIGGSPEDLEDLVRGFFEEGQTMLDDARAAAATGDEVVLKRAAHSLKSNARELGALGFADLCAAIEVDLISGQTASDMTGRVAALLALWPDVCAALEAELDR
ncbi:Hpt domain-containing protein [Roseicyclus mahoneyensis]|uniref:HPt (Histidine-containing phosphotransfer) domain-containing protein n=1 Tax=Roseicyclus mahoneyensis TaxID=164332 RepID=A0A316GE76_9RHOB|nr:Hpt domain-containing protein [Roseicyclus mahoneyensis]PWK59244.1 HPt (histidine-containing phosphotransfer) domain-containing protein [Roseicyclus mahoneyensis]